jgi:GNAT superfamily N-acetyltransferase
LVKGEYGIVLAQNKNRFGRIGKLLVHGGPQSVLGIGPPGEGKTNGVAAPTLLKSWLYWSAIVFDPAAELAPLTADARKEHTRILVFDPRDPGSACFNPLSGVRVGDVDSVRTIMASFLLERDLGEMTEQERFFSGSALELGTALVLHAMELGTPTFAHAAKYYYDPAWTTDAQFFESLLKSEIPYVFETASKFGRMTEKQRSPIVATLTQQLDLFRTPDVARVTEGSSFSAADLRRAPTTLYLVVRERDKPSLNPLMRMLLTRLLDDLTEAVPSEREQPILLLVDEFPLLRAPVIQRKLATMRKYRIRVTLLAQTLSQIRNYYGQNESISGLCDVRVFFPSVDGATQTWLLAPAVKRRDGGERQRAMRLAELHNRATRPDALCFSLMSWPNSKRLPRLSSLLKASHQFALAQYDRMPTHDSPTTNRSIRMSKTDAFFDEYETVFEKRSTLGGGARRSSRFPYVTLRLCASEYHPRDVGVDVDWLFAERPHRGQGLEEQALEFVKDLAARHGLVLATFTQEPDEQEGFRKAGFVACNHRVFGPGGAQFEWPCCWHESPENK